MKINILIPSEYKTTKGEEAIKCSVKASDGHLYPLKNSMIFIHKPVILIKMQEIKYVEFTRVGNFGGTNSRSFDITVTKLKDDSQTTFAGIMKEEQKNLINYFKSKDVKIRILEDEKFERNNYVQDDDSEDDDEEESKGKGVRAKGAAAAGGDLMNDDYDS